MLIVVLLCIQVVANFCDGGYNTLVATCVREEGLDIGDVNLIICFDAHNSPARWVEYDVHYHVTVSHLRSKGDTSTLMCNLTHSLIHETKFS